MLNMLKIVKIGALVNKYQAFSERKWERSVIEITDIIEPFNSYLTIEFYNLSVVRVLPQIGFFSNAWLPDFVRTYYLNVSLLPAINILVRVSGLLEEYLRVSLLASFKMLNSFFRVAALSLKTSFTSYRRVILSMILGELNDFKTLKSILSFGYGLDMCSFFSHQKQNNIKLLNPKVHGYEDKEADHPSKLVMVVIDGNTKKPSDYSK